MPVGSTTASYLKAPHWVELGTLLLEKGGDLP